MASSSITQSSENTARSVLKAFLVRPVAFHPVLARICGSVPAGLMLGQALYWNDRTDDTGWFYKTAEEWTEEICLSRYEQQAARAKLRDLGLLQEKFMASPPKLYFRVNVDAVSDAIFRFSDGAGKGGRLKAAKASRQPAKNSQDEPTKDSKVQPASFLQDEPTRISQVEGAGNSQDEPVRDSHVHPTKDSQVNLQETRRSTCEDSQPSPYRGSETTAETTTETTTSKALPPYPPASGEGEVQRRKQEQEQHQKFAGADGFEPHRLGRGASVQLGPEGGSSAPAESFWQVILAELKSAMYTASLNANLPNEYDKYFRDSWQLEIVDGELVLGAENPELLREGLKKYARRIGELSQRMVGIAPVMRVVDRVAEVQL